MNQRYDTLGFGLLMLAMSVFALLALIDATPGLRNLYDVFKDFGWIATATAAGVAILVAVRNVRKQVRMSLIPREEELIESQQEGLDQAIQFMYALSGRVRRTPVSRSAGIVADYNAAQGFDAVMAIINRDATAANTSLKRELVSLVQSIAYAQDLFEISSPDAVREALADDDHPPTEEHVTSVSIEWANEAEEAWKDTQDQVRTTLERLRARRELWKQRRVQFRREIETYFDEGK